MSFYNESAYEQCLIELFRDILGWDYCYGSEPRRAEKIVYQGRVDVAPIAFAVFFNCAEKYAGRGELL